MMGQKQKLAAQRREKNWRRQVGSKGIKITEPSSPASHPNKMVLLSLRAVTWETAGEAQGPRHMLC